MSIVTDFKSINRKLNRMDQKVEWDAKNPPEPPAMYGQPYATAVPYGYVNDQQLKALTDWVKIKI